MLLPIGENSYIIDCMGVTTSHHISNYYDFFRDKEIVFTKANVKALRMDPRQIYLKCNGGQWPCIINSSSLQQAKVFIGANSGVYSLIKKEKNLPISIRYCFFDNNNTPVQFFVNSTVTEVKPYGGSTELVIVTLTFTQRPPDDLILRLGEFLEVNENFLTRKEERISLNEKSLRMLSIPKEESYIFIAGVPRKCIMKDLSFGGVRVMLVGIPKFLMGKLVELKLFFTDTNEKVSVPGIVKGANFLEGRQDICVINVEFNVDEIPMTYKFHINSYITSYQKQMMEKQLNNQKAGDGKKGFSPSDMMGDSNSVQGDAKEAPVENKEPVSEKTEVVEKPDQAASPVVEDSPKEESETKAPEATETETAAVPNENTENK